VKKILYTGAIHTSSDYFTWLELIKTKKIPLTIIDRPQTINLGKDCELNIIYPRRSLAGQTAGNLNNSSIVVKLTYGKTKFLFTGDIESEAEGELIGFAAGSAAGSVSRPAALLPSKTSVMPLAEDPRPAAGNEILRANVLKVAHHGSNDSSGREFLEKVMPKIAVIQVGADNNFDHPSRLIVKRLQRFGARVLRTDTDGTIQLISDGENITVNTINT